MQTRTFWLTLTLLLLTPSARASDGVIEINHTCAQTGCFSGDAVGYPVEIDGTAGTSYRLTGNLIVPDANTTGISVKAPSITIDLNGFEIIGAGCVGMTSNCAPASGVGSGVSTDSPGVSVRGGTVSGMGLSGVVLGAQARISELRVRWNRVDGVVAKAASTVDNSTSQENGEDGFSVSKGSTVSRCTAYLNGSTGIRTSGSSISASAAYQNQTGFTLTDGSTATGITASENSAVGIFASTGSSVSYSTAHGNGTSGILAESGSRIANNTVRDNGTNGIEVASRTFVIGNLATSHEGGPGLQEGIFVAGSNNRVDGNTMYDNDIDLHVDCCDNSITRNTISSSTTFSSGNNVAPFVDHTDPNHHPFANVFD